MATKAELTTGSASAATEHTEEPQLAELVTQEAGFSTEIKSLDDVVSKLSSDCDESAAALRNGVQTLQRGVQAEIRHLCKLWGVQLTRKNGNGKYNMRGDDVPKSKLAATFIEKAREHFRTKATETEFHLNDALA